MKFYCVMKQHTQHTARCLANEISYWILEWIYDITIFYLNYRESFELIPQLPILYISCVCNWNDQASLHIMFPFGSNILCFFHTSPSILHHLQVVITNSHHDQRLVGLIAQLVVEHCTSIAEIMGSNPFRTEFFQASTQLLSKLGMSSYNWRMYVKC